MKTTVKSYHSSLFEKTNKHMLQWYSVQVFILSYLYCHNMKIRIAIPRNIATHPFLELLHPCATMFDKKS